MLCDNGINKNIKLTWLVSISIQTIITYNMQVMEVLLMLDLSLSLGYIANNVYFPYFFSLSWQTFFTFTTIIWYSVSHKWSIGLEISRDGTKKSRGKSGLEKVCEIWTGGAVTQRPSFSKLKCSLLFFNELHFEIFWNISVKEEIKRMDFKIPRSNKNYVIE